MGDDDVFFKNRIEDMPNLNLVFRYSDAAMPSVSRDARAELAQLRADLQAAREIIGVAKNDYQSDVQDGVDSYDKCQRCIDWLAANPAPQEPQS